MSLKLTKTEKQAFNELVEALRTADDIVSAKMDHLVQQLEKGSQDCGDFIENDHEGHDPASVSTALVLYEEHREGLSTLAEELGFFGYKVEEVPRWLESLMVNFVDLSAEWVPPD